MCLAGRVQRVSEACLLVETNQLKSREYSATLGVAPWVSWGGWERDGFDRNLGNFGDGLAPPPKC